SDTTLRRPPDEFVHLKLKTDVQIICQNPFDDLAWIDSSEDWREQHGAAAGGKVATLHFIARPLVIFPRTDNEFHFISSGEVVNVRPKIPVHFAAPRCL